jgi:hypothetical protein
VIRTVLTSTILLALAAACAAQQSPSRSQEPPVKVNVLNVCTPSDEEQKEMATALAQVSRQPKFGSDFEVSRGHSTLEDSTSDWVRVRREFAGGPFTTAQYSFSKEKDGTREGLVLFSREAKGVTQIALEDKVTTPVDAASLLATNTPANRISLERFGKPHLVLARCEAVDQSKYEPLFRTATDVMATYRAVTGAREIVPSELGRLSLGVGPGYRPPKVKPMVKR